MNHKQDYQRITKGIFHGTLAVPGSKSLTHRCLIMAAFAAAASGKPTVVRHPLRSDDTDITLVALQAMGYEAERSHSPDGEAVRFSGKSLIPDASPENPVKIYVHHSGTSARLLTAVAAVQPVAVMIDGSERMRQRPMQELIEPLEQLGAEIQSASGFLPITITKPVTHGTRVAVDASKSSQFLSALLQIAPLLDGMMTIDLSSEISSKSYSDMTITLMRQAGVVVEETSSGYTVRGGQPYVLAEWFVEGDYSAVSYPFAGAAISGGEVTVSNVVQDSLQGDRAILDILSVFGAEVRWNADGKGATVRGTGVLHGVDRDMNTCPDIVPTVAVLAMFADSPTRLRNVEHLRYKESDRISAVIEGIERLGGRAFVDEHDGNALVIEPVEPSKLHGAKIRTFDDHRMAMCFALAGLRIDGVEIEDPSCVAKSYPGYWRDFLWLIGMEN